MDTIRFERLVTIMTAIAAGDRAAQFTLYTEFGGHIAAAVRRELRRFGVTDIASDDLDGLVIDTVLALAECAAGWQPDRGALPWTWAVRRIAAVVSGWIGVHADPYDPAVHDRPVDEQIRALGNDAEDLDVLARLGGSHPLCALLVEALTEVASPRDQALVIGVKVQQSLGDPSPATTLAGLSNLRPDAVRQAVKRVSDRIRRLAATDDRYAPLADIPLLA